MACINGRRLMVGITGSVTATMIHPYLADFRRRGALNIDLLLSKNGARFVNEWEPWLFEGGAVYRGGHESVPDIDFLLESSRPDIVVVMPATANTLAKAAHGICDDLVSTAIITARCPVLFAPSMNDSMWASPVVQRNVAAVRALGYHLIEPGPGYAMIDLEPVNSAMASVSRIARHIEKLL